MFLYSECNEAKTKGKNIFKFIVLNENYCSWIQILLQIFLNSQEQDFSQHMVKRPDYIDNSLNKSIGSKQITRFYQFLAKSYAQEANSQ